MSPGSITGRAARSTYADAPGTGYIHLTDEPLREAAGESDIVATNIKVFSTAPLRTPDTFTNKAYTLTLFLLDVESGLGNTLTFNGIFNGSISRFSANVDNQFVGDTTQELIFGPQSVHSNDRAVCAARSAGRDQFGSDLGARHCLSAHHAQGSRAFDAGSGECEYFDPDCGLVAQAAKKFHDP